jgi:hypothetical protein
MCEGGVSKIMSTFGFRLRFHVPPGNAFKGAQRRLRIHIHIPDGRVYLSKVKRHKKNSFGLPLVYAFIGAEFSTKELALVCGQKLKQALSILMAERGIGVNVGKDRATSSTNNEIKEMMKEKHGVQLRDDIHGLDVYREDPPVRRIDLFMRGTVSGETTNFQQRLAQLYSAEVRPSQKQELALDIYNLVHFEQGGKSRFLTLITVIEVLAKRDRRSFAVRELMKFFSKHVADSGLSNAEKKQITDGLGNLKKDSISDSCRKLIAQYASGSDVDYFMDCYKARSELVHDGLSKRPEANNTTRLDKLVCHVLLSDLNITN